jgi:hypothetical protein
MKRKYAHRSSEEYDLVILASKYRCGHHGGSLRSLFTILDTRYKIAGRPESGVRMYVVKMRIGALKELFRAEGNPGEHDLRLNTAPSYQRLFQLDKKLAWDVVYAVLTGKDIQTFTFRMLSDMRRATSGKAFEALDSQHRCMFLFLYWSLRAKAWAAPKLDFPELNRDEVGDFMDYEITVNIYPSSMTDSQARNVFLAMNTSRALAQIELLLSHPTAVATAISQFVNGVHDLKTNITDMSKQLPLFKHDITLKAKHGDTLPFAAASLKSGGKFEYMALKWFLYIQAKVEKENTHDKTMSTLDWLRQKPERYRGAGSIKNLEECITSSLWTEIEAGEYRWEPDGNPVPTPLLKTAVLEMETHCNWIKTVIDSEHKGLFKKKLMKPERMNVLSALIFDLLERGGKIHDPEDYAEAFAKADRYLRTHDVNGKELVDDEELKAHQTAVANQWSKEEAENWQDIIVTWTAAMKTADGTIPGVTIVDRKRKFSDKTKGDQLVKQGHVCAIDGAPLTWESADAAHIEAWSNGGVTEPANMLMVRRSHNANMKIGNALTFAYKYGVMTSLGYQMYIERERKAA